MSKGQQRSNREAKKPKQPKPKPAAAAPSFLATQPKSGFGSSAGKRK
jgi:hypothetical protein